MGAISKVHNLRSDLKGFPVKKKKKNYSTRNHFGICPICDVCVFDMDFSNARSAVADGEVADVQISADELFHALRLV